MLPDWPCSDIERSVIFFLCTKRSVCLKFILWLWQFIYSVLKPIHWCEIDEVYNISQWNTNSESCCLALHASGWGTPSQHLSHFVSDWAASSPLLVFLFSAVVACFLLERCKFHRPIDLFTVLILFKYTLFKQAHLSFQIFSFTWCT